MFKSRGKMKNMNIVKRETMTCICSGNLGFENLIDCSWQSVIAPVAWVVQQWQWTVGHKTTRDSLGFFLKRGISMEYTDW